jgi:hypothetical protein
VRGFEDRDGLTVLVFDSTDHVDCHRLHVAGKSIVIIILNIYFCFFFLFLRPTGLINKITSLMTCKQSYCVHVNFKNDKKKKKKQVDKSVRFKYYAGKFIFYEPRRLINVHRFIIRSKRARF